MCKILCIRVVDFSGRGTAYYESKIFSFSCRCMLPMKFHKNKSCKQTLAVFRLHSDIILLSLNVSLLITNTWPSIDRNKCPLSQLPPQRWGALVNQELVSTQKIIIVKSRTLTCLFFCSDRGIPTTTIFRMESTSRYMRWKEIQTREIDDCGSVDLSNICYAPAL